MLTSILVGAILFAQSSPTAANLPKPGKIEGRVVNSVTQEPVRKATVTLVATAQTQGERQQGPGRPGGFLGGGANRLAVTTDAEGKFFFEDVPAGNYRVMVEKAGFVRGNGFGGGGFGPGGFGGRGGFGGGLNIGSAIRVAEGGFVSDLRVKLMPQGVASGKVLDEDGEPFGQVRVTLFEWNYAGGNARLMGVGSAETNELGDFRIANLAPGRYYVAAEKGGSFTTGKMRKDAKQVARDQRQQAPLVAGEETYTYARTYHPGVAEIEQAQRIEIQAGQEMSGLLLHLRRTRVFTVAGSLGNLPADGRYVVQLSRNNVQNLAMADLRFGGGGIARIQDGMFSLANVLPGSYVVRVSEMNNRMPKLIARGEVNVGNEDVTNVALAGVAPAAVKGRLRIEGQNTLPQNAQSLRVDLRPLDGGLNFQGRNAQIGPDGSFAVADLSPDIYGISVAAERMNQYVKAMTWNGQAVGKTGVDLRGGGEANLEIVLSPKVASITGRVQLAEGADAGAVIVVKEPYDPRQFGARVQRATVGADGSFSLANLEPGTYRLLAHEEPDAKLMYDPDWLAAQASEAAVVEVGESGTKTVALRQIRR
jgi:hypothetical protein